jgi:IS5 family transposase
VIRDLRRKINGQPDLEGRFAEQLALAVRLRFQHHRQRGRKVYALHAPEVKCIGKGKARAPYEFGCKVLVTTRATKPKGGQFVLHAKVLHGNPFDGHTLGRSSPSWNDRQTGVETRRIHADKGYRGHNHPQKFRVWISGQVRRVTAQIRREMERRAAVEPVIGHLKAEHRMGRNHLKGCDGDRANAVLAAAGYNFALLLCWLAQFLRALFRLLLTLFIGAPTPA